MVQETIKVSVVCMTYNQEKYIEKCISSLINQKTTFRYEIIIHDDCSTDGTVNILKEYKKSYPDKISLIVEEINQYSKGVNILDDIVIPCVQGKYIAICEGDDYWTDKYKLQKQLNAMDNNPQCWICTHGVNIVNEDNSKVIGKITPSDRNCIFSVDQVIDGDGGFVGTNSIMIKKDIYEKNYQFERIYPLDYFLQIMGSLHGGMIYISEDMSAYRSFSEGSWSSRMQHDKKKFCKHYAKVILALQKLDEETEKKYHNNIEKKIYQQQIEILKLNREYKVIIRNKELFNTLSFVGRMKICILAIAPWVKGINVKGRIGSGK